MKVRLHIAYEGQQTHPLLDFSNPKELQFVVQGLIETYYKHGYSHSCNDSLITSKPPDIEEDENLNDNK